MSVAYGAGLRVSELVALKLSAVHSQRSTTRQFAPWHAPDSGVHADGISDARASAATRSDPSAGRALRRPKKPPCLNCPRLLPAPRWQPPVAS